MPVPHTVIIGAGLAGLAAACHLTGSGRQVTVVEAAPGPGGRCGRFNAAGFTFDTGPTVLTMRGIIADTLAAAGASIDDLLPMHRLDPAYRASFADGSTIDVPSSRDAIRREIGERCGAVDADAFDQFADWLQRLYDVEMPHFINRNFDSVLDLLRTPAAILTLVRLGGFGRLGPAMRRRFTDPRLHRLFSFQALYAGLRPDQALALYAVITYMDVIEGVWACDGGMYALPVALADAAQSAGVQFRYGSAARQIRFGSDGSVSGVDLADGERLQADTVICTVDIARAYRDLLPDLHPPRSLRRAAYAPSAAVWHVGVRGLPAEGTAHHNIHFGEQWTDAFSALIDRRELMPDPSRLVSVPSLSDASLAPPGCSTLYVLEPVPNATGRVDWHREAEPMRERLAKFLDREGYPSDVVTGRLVTPQEWQDQELTAGTPFSLAHTFSQTGPFRPSNTVRHRPGLVFAGAGTVPGVGVPMVLISGRLAAQRVTDLVGAA